MSEFYLHLTPFLENPNFILSIETPILIQIVILNLVLLLTGLFFAVFITLASDIKIILPTILLASLTAFLFTPASSASILVIGSLVALGVSYFFLQQELKNYLTFQPTKLLGPTLGHVTLFLTLTASVAFYLVSSTQIATEGFTIPDSLIETALKVSGADQISKQVESSLPPEISQTTLTPEMIAAAKQNPELLKQAGIDPKMLDLLSTQKSPQKISTVTQTSQALLKPMVEQQLQNIVQPFTGYISLALTGIFFITILSLTSLLSLPVKALLWMIFAILNKTGFTTYTTETREVKKLVV